MRRLITLFIALTLVLSLFAGCKQTDEKTTTDVKEEVNDEANADANGDANGDANAEDVSATENSGEFKDVVLLKVNDEEVMLSVGNILLYQIKSYYESIYGPTVWDMEAEAGVSVESFVKNDIKDVSVRTEVLYDVAMEKGYTLEDGVEEELLAQATTVFESYTPEIIAKYGFTIEQVKDTILKQGYSEVVFEEMTKDFVIEDSDVLAEMEKNEVYQNMMLYGIDSFYDKVRARHILIKTVDDKDQPVSTEAYAAARKKIEGILKRVNDGEDFTELATEFSEDPGSADTGGEYTFSRGEMVPEFEAGAYGLEIGGISDVIETQYGFHIIKLEERIPATDEEIKKAKAELETIREESEYLLKVAEFDKIYETIISEYTVTVNDEIFEAMTFKDAVE